MILEILTICGLIIIVGLGWLSARVQEAAAAGDVSRVPPWMKGVWRFISEETEEFPRLKNLTRNWRWFLLGFYLFILVMIIFNPDPQRASFTTVFNIVLALLNAVVLAGWIYYIERLLKRPYRE